MKTITGHISKQRALQPSSPHVTPTPKVSPEETQDRNIVSPSNHHTLQPPLTPWWTLGKIRMREPGYRPRQPRCISKECFQWAQTLASSHRWKNAKFLNLGVWFSLINGNLLTFQLPDLYILAPPCLPPGPDSPLCLFGADSQSDYDLRCYAWRLKFSVLSTE